MASPFSPLTRAVLVSLCVWLLSTPANAQTTHQQPDETLPGFKSQQVYEVNGVDNVNLYSGDVHVTVPLGPDYPLSSGLTWRLAAHYSSKFWHMFQYDSGVFSAECPGQKMYVSRAHVGGYSTLGAGWTLELGFVRPGKAGVEPSSLVYKSPDGAHHSFTNLDADADYRFDPQADGTYFVRKADGTVLRFTHLYEIPPAVNGFDFSDEDRDPIVPRQTLRYGLDSILDRFSNKVLQVNYAANCVLTPCPANAWKVLSIDLSNPSRTINFDWAPPSGSFDVLSAIRFPVVGGGTPLTAVFSSPLRDVFRPLFGSAPVPAGGRNIPIGPTQTILPFLTSITQASQTYAFNYDASNGGVLNTMTLPTGGRISYGYSSYTAFSPKVCSSCRTCQACVPETDAGVSCGVGSNGPIEPPASSSLDRCSVAAVKQQFIDSSPAVISRTEQDLAGGAPDSTTTYERDQFGSPDSPGSLLNPDRIVRRVIVKRPGGNADTLATKHIFAASPNSSAGSELSRRYYADCKTAGTPVRSVVQCYPAVPSLGHPADRVCGVMEGPALIGSLLDVSSLRPNQQVTWYGANPLVTSKDTCNPGVPTACWQDAFTDFNPSASEYSTVTRSSNSDILSYPQYATRTTTTTWVPVSVPGGTWLPKLYSAKTATDAPCMNAPCTTTTNYSFDTANGFLKSSWVSDPTSGTLTRSWTPDPGPDAFDRENPKTETVSASFDSTSYVSTRTFRSGLMATTQRAGIGWRSFDVDRDARTGLITTSRDPNLLVTTYGYDSLSRLTSITPPGELASTYCYFDWSTTLEMSAVFAKKAGIPMACSPDDGGPPQFGSGPFEAYQYDGMGRVKRQMRRLPTRLSSGSYFAAREFRYNDAGLKVFESEWIPCGASPSEYNVRSCFSTIATSTAGTNYSNFDFLGRPRTIQLADGKLVTKSFNDPAGVPNSDFTELTTADVGGVTVNSASRKDILGRLLIAAEPAPAPYLYGRTTNYAYNVLDKLVSASVAVTSGDPNDPPVTPQNRSFVFDSLGLLRSETHPEKGTTRYTSYNALGGVLTKKEGAVVNEVEGVNVHTYTFVYDALGRPTSTSVGGQQYLSNLYDIDVYGVPNGGYTLGKLVQQNSFHPQSDQNLWVAHNYAYRGLGGRLSAEDSYAFINTGLFHTQASFSWNNLGLLDTHNHDRATPSIWGESTTYVSGMPYRVTADGKTFVASSTFNPSGGLLSYQTGNGVTTFIDPDASLMPRPAQIRTTGANVNFSTGAYSYDGSGNITSISTTDTYSYNARGFLTGARYAAPQTYPSDSFTYDAFGNQTRRDWEGGAQLFTTDPASNRLSDSSYDFAGNLTVNGPDRHTYDALSRQTRYVGSGATERYFYDGAGERIARVVGAASLPQQSTQERFYNLAPCRILDTRDPAGTYGAPSIQGQGSRSFPVAGRCGIPSNAKSLALNVTTVNAGTTGSVRLFPTGLSYQPLGSANVFKPGYPRANQTIGSIDGPTAGSFTLFNDAPAVYPVDVIVDVQGYFAPGPSTPPQTGDSWFLTARNLGKKPSTEFRYDTATGQSSVLKDYVYFGGQLVGTYTTTGSPNGTVFYTNDHLGSPRFLTAGASPTKLAEYKYRAFGLALSSTIPGQGPEFASMERDLASSDLYDHARYVGGKLGRFKSPDQLGGHAEDPQSWNRYAYARNDPLKYVDPDGQAVVLSQGESEASVAHKNQQRALAALVDPQTMRSNWDNGNYWFDVATAFTNTVLSDPTLAMMPMAGTELPTGEFSIIRWTGYPEALPKPL